MSILVRRSLVLSISSVLECTQPTSHSSHIRLPEASAGGRLAISEGDMRPLWRRRQICAFLAAACLAATRTRSTIVVYSKDSTTVPTQFEDQPAKAGFGPGIPDKVSGGGCRQHSVLIRNSKKWRQIVWNPRCQFLCNRSCTLRQTRQKACLRSLLIVISYVPHGSYIPWTTLHKNVITGC